MCVRVSPPVNFRRASLIPNPDPHTYLHHAPEPARHPLTGLQYYTHGNLLCEGLALGIVTCETSEHAPMLRHIQNPKLRPEPYLIVTLKELGAASNPHDHLIVTAISTAESKA